MISSNQPVMYYQYNQAGWEPVNSGVITEMPVTLWVNGLEWLTFLCTPTRLEALAVGFLWNEGIISTASEVIDVRPCRTGAHIDVWLSHAVQKPAQWRRTSGCTGGVTRVDPLQISVENLSTQRITPEMVIKSMEELLKIQTLYRQVRGVHCSAVGDGERIVAHAEDIGRHNTLDKIAGILLLENIHMQRCLVLTTGRISSEMLQKSARLNASAVISRTSPSSLSIQLAEELGITLVGYARRTQFNVYAHSERFSEPAHPVTISTILNQER